MSRTKLSQNSIAAGAINANTMFAADVVSPHAVANTSTYSVAELLVGGKILLDNVGHVGIGTTSPTTFSGYTTLHHHNTGGDAIHLIQSDGGIISQTIVNDASSAVTHGARSNHAYRITTNDTERLRITTAGDVGIGATPSYAKLQITGGAGSLPSETASGETILQVQNNAGATDTARMSIISGTSGQSNLDFGDSGDENMGSVYYSNATNLMGLRTSGSGVDLIIDSNGKVGIGSTSPAALLHVEGTGKFVTGTDANGFIISENANNDQAISLGVTGGSGSGTAYIKAFSGASDSVDLVFQTANSGTEGTAFTLRANNSAEFSSHFSAPAAGSQFLVGHSSYVNTGTSAYSQIHYANKGNTLLLGEWSSTNASYPALRMLKSASSTIGTNAIVADGEHLGAVEFNAADGVDYISVAAAIRAYVNGTPGDSDMPGALTFDTTADGAYGTSERVRITSAGKVGIATTAPTGYLEIGPTGTNTESIILKRTQAGHNNIIKLMTSSTDDWIIGQRNSGSTSDFRFYSYGASNDVLTILRANGYVGIGAGITAPEARLEVLGNSDSVAGIKIGANATHGWHFYDSSTNGDLHIKSEASGTQTEVIRFTRANQYVGIGTTAPHRRLHIAGGTATGLQITGNSTGAGSGDGMMISIRNDNNGVEFIQQENSHIAFQTNGSATSGLIIKGTGDIYTPTAGSANLRLGQNAGLAIASGCNYNTIIGDDAGTSLNSGDANVFVGQKAGYDETGGYGNVAVGYQAGENSDGADYYVAVGTQALQDQDDGQFNTAVGYFAMGDATDTGYNVGLGPYTFQKGTSGSYGVAIANGALRDNTSAHYNIAIGYHCMLLNTTGQNNVAMGAYAMDATVTGGSYNVAIGYGALSVMGNDTVYNTALGYNAMGALTTGEYNVAVGGNALSNNTVTGDGNIGVGQNALHSLGVGGNNTAVGNYAGDNITTGSHNISLGSHAQPSAADSQYQIVIGDNIPGGENNQVTIGKTGNVIQNEFDTDAAWTRTSDVRKKRNIKENELGLEFVNNLRTVTYQWKPSNEFPKEWDEYSEENNMNLDAVMHGMIAQEVKEALDKSGCDTFTGWKERSDGSQTVSREMFVMPLIKAVQELSAKVKELEDKLNG